METTKKKSKPRHKLLKVDLPKHGEVKMYFSPKVEAAFNEVTEDMNIYKGVRLKELLSAAYSQGLKDGARLVIEEADSNLKSLKQKINYQNPGRPLLKKK